MIDYWQSLTAPMQTFVAIGSVSSLILSIQLVLSLIGGDMDGVEADLDLADGHRLYRCTQKKRVPSKITAAEVIRIRGNMALSLF